LRLCYARRTQRVELKSLRIYAVGDSCEGQGRS
jgi:hypothetical protein